MYCRPFPPIVLACGALLAVKLAAWSQEAPAKVPADTFLPAGNQRTSEVGVLRVYKTGKDRKILRNQPSGYPQTVTEPELFILQEDEALRLHEGFDLSSRDTKGRPVPMDFKAGVFGRVVDTGEKSPLGRIVVEVDERGNRVEYLDTSQCYLNVGDEVTPETRLGRTGSKASGAVHLHVQARNKRDDALNPDEVVAYAGKPCSQRRQARFFVPIKWRKIPGLDVKPISENDFEEGPQFAPRLGMDDSMPKGLQGQILARPHGIVTMGPKGGTRVGVLFRRDGSVLLYNAKEGIRRTGSWSVQGNKVKMQAGDWALEGTFREKVISGTRVRTPGKDTAGGPGQDQQDSWSMTFDP